MMFSADRCPGVRPTILGLLALLSVGTNPADAQQDMELTGRLDSIAGAAVREGRAVGIVAAVVRGRDTLLLRAYGEADAEGHVPMSLDEVIPIGSVTKQFTAAAILRLRDAGRLSLDDDLTRWLPDFETHGNEVTLRRLLDHTSGITDGSEMPELRAMRVMLNPSVTRDAVYQVMNGYPFRFPTGTLEVYSNSNFWLLGLVVERASGMTYEDYVEKEIFERLGMSRSMYCDNSEDVPRRAWGHGMRNGIVRRAPAIVHTATYAAGALCSTAGDMVTWLEALHGGTALPPGSYEEMVTPSTLSDGTPLRYSMGLTVAEDGHGLPYIGHSGGGFGFSSEARWYPNAELAVVVLTNSEPDEITATTEDLVAAVLAPSPSPRFTGDASALVGEYEGLGPGGDMVIGVAESPDGIAFSINGAPREPLSWVDGWTFRRGTSLLTFRGGPNGGPAAQLTCDTGGDHFTLRKR